MSSSPEQTNLKKIIGAMLFAAKKTLTVTELKKIIIQTAAEEEEAACRQFSKVKENEIYAVLEQIKVELLQIGHGIRLAEVGGGFRLQTDPDCSPWLRQLLNSGRPTRLSKPTLETLAIIAYRQPVARSEIEAVRGVNVDAIVRHLLECQLIKITGRSNLPGHPLLYGTSQLFLEHFGLQSINHLPGVEQLRRKEEARMQTQPAPVEDKDDDDNDEDDDEQDSELDEKEQKQNPPEQQPAGVKEPAPVAPPPEPAPETASQDKPQ